MRRAASWALVVGLVFATELIRALVREDQRRREAAMWGRAMRRVGER